jgi:hypothetical protein
MESMERRMLFDASVLTEAIISKTIPASLVSNAPLHAAATVQVTNRSGTTQSGPYEIGVFFADGALDIPSKNFVILGTRHVGNLALANGKSKTFAVRITRKPNTLNLGVDTLYAVAVDPSNAFSQSAASGTMTVIPPPPPDFADAILKATPNYKVSGTQEAADQLDLEMSIQNSGGLSSGSDQFALFASASSTFDSSAIEIGQAPRNLKIPHNATRRFAVNFVPTNLSNQQGTEVDQFIFVQVTDTSGGVTLAGFAKELKLAGPA